MKNPPTVSVIMPVYNGEPFLEQALLSVLNQSLEDFELLVVDDGSTDSSMETVSKYARLDRRIRVITHPRNLGLVAALNSGIERARGGYLARMDQDDISLRDRFIAQVGHLESHPETGLVGCRVRHIDESGRLLSTPRVYLDSLSISWQIMFHNPFYHATVMLRKQELDRRKLRYDPEFENGEDYDLWSRFLMHTGGENLPEILLHYRVHPASMSERGSRKQRRNAADIASLTIHRHYPEAQITPSQARELTYAFLGIDPDCKRQRARALDLYLKVWAEFTRCHRQAAGLAQVRQDALAWAARMVLYPPFQAGTIRALGSLTSLDWRWPWYLLGKLPAYLFKKWKVEFFH